MFDTFYEMEDGVLAQTPAQAKSKSQHARPRLIAAPQRHGSGRRCAPPLMPSVSQRHAELRYCDRWIECCEARAERTVGLPAAPVADTLAAVLAINATMFCIEFGAGLLRGLTALLADSLDTLGDSLVYGFSLLSSIEVLCGALARLW